MNFQSAFHHVPVREEEKATKDENISSNNNVNNSINNSNASSKNRMADFWEKSIQLTSQVQKHNSFLFLF